MSGFRNRLLKSVLTGGLPSGYYLCEYIESDGTNYINTEFNPNQDTRIVIDIELSKQSSYPRWVFGGRNASSSVDGAFTLLATSASAFRSGYNTVSYGVSTSTIGRFLIDKNKNVITINNESFTQTVSTFQSNYPIGLFSICIPSGVDSRMTQGKIYSCKIYDNGNIVRDYIPCLNPDGYFGLYDKVGKKFYGSANDNLFTGEILIGEQSYTGIKSLTSDGTVYFDTGFIPNQDTRVVTDVKFQLDGSNDFLFGARYSEYKNTYGFNAYKTYYRTHYNTEHPDYAKSVSYTSRFTIDKNKNITTIGGSNVIEQTYSAFEAPCSMYIFAVNENGTAKTYGVATIYNFKIYDNDKLVRFYIPVSNSDGVSGLLDLVNQTFDTYV